jgi:tungstate transport system substrate-binding protein
MAHVHPAQERLIQTGEGMGTTLRITSAMAGYTLTDRATFVQLRPQLDLQIVKEGDWRLLNTYAVIANPANALAMDFARWLTDGGGRSTIDAYRVGANVQAFFPWPLDRPRERPENAPR